MCGICGIAYDDTNRAVDAAQLVRLRDRMIHRGPDDSGIRVRANVGLGHRRLSIIDRSGGQQPLSNEDGTVWIVFNGEIYNYRELRAELEGKGHVFRTNSDTETIVHLYEQYGTACVERLNGMFAFAIWDQNSQELFLARDRMGIKPLYIWRGEGAFVFGSEMKALLDYPDVQRELNSDVIPDYLVFRYPTGNQTFFKSIQTLEPGHFLVWKQGEVAITKYWQLRIDDDAGTSNTTAGLQDELDALLEDAVRIRLMSEVPLGTYCSGGVDSSLLTAFCARHSAGKLNTFSVGFEEEEFDESRYSQMVSSRYGTDHHQLVANEQDYVESFQKAVWLLESPLNHAHSVQLHLISKLAKEFVTVMLSGEGSDELFGGYPRYRALAVRGALESFPGIVRAGAASLLRPFASSRIQKLRAAMCGSIDDAIVENARFVTPAIAQSVFTPDAPGFGWGGRNAYLRDISGQGNDPLQKLLYLDQKTYLVSLLDRQDKMSMGASIEARVPFLDYRLVRFAMRVGSTHKVKMRETKYVLKKLAERYLPREIVYRNKSGFGVPLARWFRNSNGLGQFLDLLSSQKFRERGLWNVSHVNRLLDEHRKAVADNSEILWELLNVEIWMNTYLDRDGRAPL
jgi:asparagine synthase (glutamine-hydrolysing)